MFQKQQLSFGNLAQLMVKYSTRTILTPFYDEDYQKFSIEEKVNTQFNIMSNIFAVIYGTPEIQHEAPMDKGRRNKLLHGKESLPKHMSICNVETEKSRKMLKEFILPFIERRTYFISDLFILIDNMPESMEKCSLKSYKGKEEEFAQKDSEEFMDFLLKCLNVSLRLENDKKKILEEDQFFDPKIDDPHGRGESKPCSTAIEINITIDNKISHVFYDFRKSVDFIIENNLKIVTVNTIFPKILVEVEELENLILKRIEKDEYQKVYEFIKSCNDEFRPKVSWRGRYLYDMALNGLQTGKWSAYGYFDQDGNIVGYTDIKLRADGSAEIGISLVENEYRQQHLTSSLLFLFKLEYPHYGFYIGIFEENEAMISIFEQVGYEPNLLSVTLDGKKTNKIKERIHPAHPDNYKYNTNSAYFKMQPLYEVLKESRLS